MSNKKPTKYQTEIIDKLKAGHMLFALKHPQGQSLARIYSDPALMGDPVSITTILSMEDKGLIKSRIEKRSYVDRKHWELVR